MPTWSNQLPAPGKHMGFDLRRTPQSSSLQAVITCDQLLVCDTHYFHGRTTPCERPDCPACNEGLPYRTHCYVSAFDHKKKDHFLFECTALAAKPFQEQYDSAGTLRGCIFHAARPKGTPNGKVAIATNTVFKSNSPLPQPPDLIKALSVIWRLPTAALDTAPTAPGTNRLSTDPAPLARMRLQPDNAADPPTVATILRGNGHTTGEPL